MALPSAIIAQYRDGTLTREQAADALTTAEWDDNYTRASMRPGGDYDGDVLPDEGFAAVVYTPSLTGQLDDADYAAFHEAFAQWRAGRT